ncbi:MAG: sigma-70 family RNA polymerase sigma factor [Proteobacteria bacterium]|nr:sigma-70 family RNA polymerase sigma factor [Pseudomonadota bacterium]
MKSSVNFATTSWSLVLAAGERGSVKAEQALERLCALYWYPIFAFVRRQGHGADAAQDLTQGFFSVLIGKGEIARADRARGRFRSFLLASCQHFLANERDRDHALKRGGGVVSVPIDIVAAEQRYERALGHAETPERFYDRQWCLTLLDAVLDDVRAHYVAAGKGRIFDVLKVFLTGNEDAGSSATIAQELGMTAGTVKVAIHRLRRRYGEALRVRIADCVSTDQDIEDEIRHLLASLGPAQEGL